MNWRTKYIICIVLLCAIIALILWKMKSSSVNHNSAVNILSNPPPSAESVKTRSMRSDRIDTATREIQSLHWGHSADLAPIEFYGVVEDQNGQSVPDVQIEYFILPTPAPPDLGLGRTVSDDAGRFHISGHNGGAITFKLTKRGYRAAERNSGATFYTSAPVGDRYTPDVSNPQVLHIWKEQGPEPLIAFSHDFECALPQCTMVIDILTGASVESGGDIRISFISDPATRLPDGSMDWRCSVEPVEGEIQIVPSQIEFNTTFAAPLNGYTNRFEINMRRADPKWRSVVSELVFLKSRSNQVFSKFALRLSVNAVTTAHISINGGLANANGSRNWEVYGNNVKEVSR